MPEADEDEEDVPDTETDEGTGSRLKLKPWHQRKRQSMEPVRNTPPSKASAIILKEEGSG